MAYRALYGGSGVYCAALGAPAGAVACALYAGLDYAQHVAGAQESLQLAQAVVAVAVAATVHVRAAALVVWLAFIAATVHVFSAVLLMEMRRMGDCRRCCNEAARCTCGKHKRPLPPGTLAHLARLLARQAHRRARKMNGPGTVQDSMVPQGPPALDVEVRHQHARGHALADVGGRHHA